MEMDAAPAPSPLFSEGDTRYSFPYTATEDRPGRWQEGVTHAPDGNTEVQSGRSQAGGIAKAHGDDEALGVRGGWVVGVGNSGSLPVPALTSLLSSAVSHQPPSPPGHRARLRPGRWRHWESRFPHWFPQPYFL